MSILYVRSGQEWSDHPHFVRPVLWSAIRGDRPLVFEARVEEELWQIRLNDFPSEPAFTLLVRGLESVHFDDWPSFWQRPAFAN